MINRPFGQLDAFEEAFQLRKARQRLRDFQAFYSPEFSHHDKEALRLILDHLDALDRAEASPPKTVAQLAEEQGLTGPPPDYAALATAAFPDGPMDRDAAAAVPDLRGRLERVLLPHKLMVDPRDGVPDFCSWGDWSGWDESRPFSDHLAEVILTALPELEVKQ